MPKQQSSQFELVKEDEETLEQIILFLHARDGLGYAIE
jgi:hypothetical protein